ncbi:Hsp70 family protein [Rhodococcus sp. CH91]|uniref:Hsp70 family protein n=1 Tax=Rhodococcus sp. CH91 TaxID=2910256 RepID=UPI001F4B301A|nr:Hsp70 family protein [Rhodococcus sp. CH91]
MPTSLGISVGASGVGSALRVDTATTPTTEFRRLAAESEPGRDLGDLVFDAVALASAQRSGTPEVTVAYRTEDQANAVRIAAERAGHMVRLVPESTAALAYLRTVGVRREPGAIALVDIGATGTTVSILDQESGTVLRSARTEEIGGAELASRVLDHVRHATERMRGRRQIDTDLLAARCQGAQEALATASSTRIDIAEAGPNASVTLTRSELDELTADLAVRVAAFTQRICTSVDPVPGTLALVGGTAASPALVAAISAGFRGEIITVPEPGAAAAIGAALSGDSDSSAGYPLVGSPTRIGGGSSGRISSVVAGILVLSAITAGYATQHFTERDNSNVPVSPLFTSGAALSPNTPPTETVIPSHDPTPEAISSRTADDDLAAPTTVPWPRSTFDPTTPTTREERSTRPDPPVTTVTPTPIDQVPTPGVAPDEAPDSTPLPSPTTTPPDFGAAPTPPDSETSPAAPDFGSTPTPDPTVAPDTTDPTAPGTTPPVTTGPAPDGPETTVPGPGVAPTTPSSSPAPPPESPATTPTASGSSVETTTGTTTVSGTSGAAPS